MLFGEKILNYWDDIMADLAKVVAIPSVCGEATEGHPFGDEPARAVDLAMELANGYGFKTKNVGYYACHAEIGEGEENAVVMAHLDVVPEGEGWDTDPYTMTEKDGYIYGRGVSDNKGPAIIALHCLRAIKDAGVVGKRKLRVVMGSGEEIGMADMEHYFASEQKPTMGFTPDGSYGICNCEKGILHFTIRSKNDSPVVTKFVSGTVVNAVPYKAEASVNCTAEELEILKKTATEVKGDFVITATETGADILSNGVASHGSQPDKGVNAATHLINLLNTVFGTKIGALLSFIQEKIGFTTDGSLIGVACEDEPSGKLTFNVGLVNVNSDTADFSVDIRYPATIDGEKLVATIEKAATDAGLEYTDSFIQAPLYLPADGKLIKILASAYEDVTGKDCEIFSMGGGTYARQMFGNGVAFGAGFPGEVDNVHNCNERANIESLKLHAQICLEAMYRLYTAD